MSRGAATTGRAGGGAAPVAVVAVSYLAGSVPFSQLAAGRFAGTDLRRVGSGTVSGSALYEVAGFGPLVAAGVVEVAKGAIGPLLARRVVDLRAPRRTPAGREVARLLGALSAGAAIAGHNWSPWLGGAGGRGLSPALGATLVLAPEGTVVLLAGMAAGRLLRTSGLATLLAALGLVPVLGIRRGAAGVALGLSISAPMVVKRALGNAPLTSGSCSNGATGAADVPLTARLFSRLLFDRDTPGPTTDAREPVR